MKDKAYSKINVSINVINRREDGYHNLDMIMVPLTLCDELDIEISDSDSFECNIDMEYNSHNTIYKAIELLRSEFGFKEHFAIKLVKNIPMEAGLAGGSADGAATMRIINEICHLGLSLEELAKRSIKIGSDLAYCMFNKPARVMGTGNIVQPFDLKESYKVLLIKPKEGVSTGKAYTTLNLDKCAHPDIDLVMDHFVNHKPLKDVLGNSLEESAVRLLDKIDLIKNDCRKFGYDNVLMSGSGSTIFVIADLNEKFEKIEKYMKEQEYFVFNTQILVD